MKKPEYDPVYLKICAYASACVLITLALSLLLINSGGFFLKAWELFTDVGTPIVYGGLICYLLLPLVRKLDVVLKDHNIVANNDRRRLNISVALTVLCVALIIVAFAMVLVLVITRSLESVSFATLRQLWSSAEGDIMKLGQNLIIRKMTKEDQDNLDSKKEKAGFRY